MAYKNSVTASVIHSLLRHHSPNSFPVFVLYRDHFYARLVSLFGGKNARFDLVLHFFLSNPFFRHDKLRNYEKKKFRFIGTLSLTNEISTKTDRIKHGSACLRIKYSDTAGDKT